MSSKAPAIRWSGVRYRPPGGREDILRGVDLAVAEGELVVLTGPTGCGKSTLLKTANGLIPRESEGTLTGEVALFGQDVRGLPSPLLRTWAGFLFQNPGDQLVCARALDEVAFGPENLGLPPEEIARRAEEALAGAAVSHKRASRCAELSGGEQQRVALASVLALRPRLLLLDEPTSQLDGAGAGAVLASLERIRARTGITAVMAEHRLDRLLPLADRLVVMDRGRVRGDYPRGRFREALPILRELGLEVPLWMELAERCGLGGLEGEEAVCACLRGRPRPPAPARRRPSGEKAGPLLRAGGLAHRYARGAPPALEGVDVELRAGEVLAVMGHNGAGKTTLLALLAGLLPLRRGKIEWFGRRARGRSPRALAGRVGFLFQNPDLMLSAATAREEVALGPRLLAFPPERRERAAASAMRLLGLEPLADRNPFSLSRGERLRLALAALLACEPRALILDEPTAGLDRGMRLRFLESVRRWAGENGGRRGVVLCTHDADAALAFADRVVVLAGGKVAAQGPAAEALWHTGEGALGEVEAPALVRAARRMGWDEAPEDIEALAGGDRHAS